MDPLRLDAAAARVVAWHNRHPLARRINATHVHSVGYVALPFERAPPQAPAEAKATPHAAALHGVFSEAFLAPLKAIRVARWAARHGAELPQDPSDAPLHFVRPDRAPVGTAEPVTLYVLTAAVQAGEQRRRVLLGRGDLPGVLGRRLWSGTRAAAALALLAVGVALAGLAVALALRPAPPGAPVQASASAASAASAAAGPGGARPSVALPGAPAASVAGAASAAGPLVTDQVTAVPLQLPKSTPPPAPPRPSILPGLDLGPHLGRIALPALRPQLGEGVKAQARQAAQATQSARAARPGASTPPTTAHAPMPGAAALPGTPALPHAGTAVAGASAPGAAVPAVPAAAKAAFAVTTPALRTHAEAEQIMDAMAALLRGAGASQAQVEILPHGEDWRVVGWPFARRDDAEKARAVLVARGMRVTVVDF
jgi:hypothetical protein